jgi:hypothetical protein
MYLNSGALSIYNFPIWLLKCALRKEGGRQEGIYHRTYCVLEYDMIAITPSQSDKFKKAVRDLETDGNQDRLRGMALELVKHKFVPGNPK